MACYKSVDLNTEFASRQKLLGGFVQNFMIHRGVWMSIQFLCTDVLGGFYLFKKLDVPEYNNSWSLSKVKLILYVLQYYIEPVSGRRFRSKVEVDYFLQTGSKPNKKQKTDADANVS